MKNYFYLLISIFFACFRESFAQNEGDNVFNSSQIHTVRFYFSQPEWYDLLIAYKPLDKKMLGNVNIDGTYIDSVGVQFKGNSYFNNPSKKKS
jgi:spore coat protein CotH